MPAPLLLIINATAGEGRADQQIEKLQESFAAAGAQARIFPAREGEGVTERALRAAEEKPPVIVAGGGDGTISAVASAIAGSDIALGVLPLGTLNHFAKDLNIPLDIDEAVRTIVSGRRIKVDVGEVNGRVFINNSSLGLYPHIVRYRERQQRRLGRGKWPALFRASVTMLRRSRFLNVRVRAGGNEERCYRTPLVFIGNNEYVMEGFSIGQRERLDAGLLSLYVIRNAGRMRLFGLAARALFGRLNEADDFDSLTAQSVEIETRRRHVAVATDGEVTTMEAPLSYRVRPGALQVIVPAEE